MKWYDRIFAEREWIEIWKYEIPHPQVPPSFILSCRHSGGYPSVCGWELWFDILGLQWYNKLHFVWKPCSPCFFYVLYILLSTKRKWFCPPYRRWQWRWRSANARNCHLFYDEDDDGRFPRAQLSFILTKLMRMEFKWPNFTSELAHKTPWRLWSSAPPRTLFHSSTSESSICTCIWICNDKPRRIEALLRKRCGVRIRNPLWQLHFMEIFRPFGCGETELIARISSDCFASRAGFDRIYLQKGMLYHEPFHFIVFGNSIYENYGSTGGISRAGTPVTDKEKKSPKIDWKRQNRSIVENRQKGYSLANNNQMVWMNEKKYQNSFSKRMSSVWN